MKVVVKQKPLEAVQWFPGVTHPLVKYSYSGNLYRAGELVFAGEWLVEGEEYAISEEAFRKYYEEWRGPCTTN